MDSLSGDPFDRRDPMGRTFPIVTSCKIQKVRSRQLFMILIGLSTSLALVDMQTMQMRCVFCQTMLCTRSSTSSYGFGSLPSPLSPSFTSCTGQNSQDPKDFLLHNGRWSGFCLNVFPLQDLSPVNSCIPSARH